MHASASTAYEVFFSTGTHDFLLDSACNYHFFYRLLTRWFHAQITWQRTTTCHLTINPRLNLGNFYFFGDSLTDTGNIANLLGGLGPQVIPVLASPTASPGPDAFLPMCDQSAPLTLLCQ